MKELLLKLLEAEAAKKVAKAFRWIGKKVKR